MNQKVTPGVLVALICGHFEVSTSDAKRMYSEFIVEQRKAVARELRDEFAKSAMQGLIAHCGVADPRVMGRSRKDPWTLQYAQRAYALADAMLVERVVENPS